MKQSILLMVSCLVFVNIIQASSTNRQVAVVTPDYTAIRARYIQIEQLIGARQLNPAVLPGQRFGTPQSAELATRPISARFNAAISSVRNLAFDFDQEA